MTKQEVLFVLLAVKEWWTPERYCADEYLDADGHKIDSTKADFGNVARTCISGAVRLHEPRINHSQYIVGILYSMAYRLYGNGILYVNDVLGYDATIKVLDYTIERLEEVFCEQEQGRAPTSI